VLSEFWTRVFQCGCYSGVCELRVQFMCCEQALIIFMNSSLLLVAQSIWSRLNFKCTEKVNVPVSICGNLFTYYRSWYSAKESGGRHICCSGDRSRMFVDVSSDWYPGYAVWLVVLLYFLELFPFSRSGCCTLRYIAVCTKTVLLSVRRSIHFVSYSLRCTSVHGCVKCDYYSSQICWLPFIDGIQAI